MPAAKPALIWVPAALAPAAPEFGRAITLDTACDAIPGALFNPFFRALVYPVPVCFPAFLDVPAVFSMDDVISSMFWVVIDAESPNPDNNSVLNPLPTSLPALFAAPAPAEKVCVTSLVTFDAAVVTPEDPAAIPSAAPEDVSSPPFLPPANQSPIPPKKEPIFPPILERPPKIPSPMALTIWIPTEIQSVLIIVSTRDEMTVGMAEINCGIAAMRPPASVAIICAAVVKICGRF